MIRGFFVASSWHVNAFYIILSSVFVYVHVFSMVFLRFNRC